MPSLWIRQYATAFNQPLSFNISSVTSMYRMFYVRSTPAHATHSPLGPMLPRPPPPRPPASWPGVSPSQHASLWTRQNARAFNQPLTFDASSVTSMRYMFQVRLRTCPILQLDGPHMLP